MWLNLDINKFTSGHPDENLETTDDGRLRME